MMFGLRLLQSVEAKFGKSRPSKISLRETMSETKTLEHTPTPWHIRDPNVAEGETIVIDCGNPEQPHTIGAVATALNFANFMSFEEGQKRCDLRMRANAAFIVEAVNNYDALQTRVTELEAALRSWVDHEGQSCFLEGVNGWCGECARCVTREALGLPLTKVAL